MSANQLVFKNELSTQKVFALWKEVEVAATDDKEKVQPVVWCQAITGNKRQVSWFWAAEISLYAAVWDGRGDRKYQIIAQQNGVMPQSKWNIIEEGGEIRLLRDGEDSSDKNYIQITNKTLNAISTGVGLGGSPCAFYDDLEPEKTVHFEVSDFEAPEFTLGLACDLTSSYKPVDPKYYSNLTSIAYSEDKKKIVVLSEKKEITVTISDDGR